jgi:hypothetical protein
MWRVYVARLVGQSTEPGRLYFRWKFCEKRPRQLLGLGDGIFKGLQGVQVEGVKAKRHGR